MNKPIISTKADTLLSLKDIIEKSYIEELLIIKVHDYIETPEETFEKIKNSFRGEIIVIRSSSKNEDSMTTSNAGHYESVLGVDSFDRDSVLGAIKTVTDSYMIDGANKDDIIDEQILVQRQSKDIELSGVVFTRDIISNRPYYMVTYDDNGSTDSVTSGQGGKTKWISKNVGREFLNQRFENLLTAIKEIEKIFDTIPALDIEFGITSEETIIIFQVRPLAAVLDKKPPMTDREFKDTKAFAKCNYLDTCHILSDMSFWNPAEIIGTSPRPLDYSLYKELIMSRIWSQGISRLGYNLVNEELMQKVGNKPYISVDYTFEGLTPSNLSEALKQKLYAYYEMKLRKDKTAHDKIEFEIIFNSYDFSTEEKLKELLENGFSKEEIAELRDSLHAITKECVVNYGQIFKDDRKDLKILTKQRHEIRNSETLFDTNVMKHYKYINELLDSIKQFGTPQFTRQARCAFMARSFCKALVEREYFTQEEMDAFMLSISTVASSFESDFYKYSHGEMSREEFNSIYGHLRLGTYNIRTDNYSKMYFDIEPSNGEVKVKKKQRSKPLNQARLQKALDDNNMSITPEELTSFIIDATRNREYFKFEFTKSLSLMLEIIIHVGNILGIAREDMSYLEIQDLISYHSRNSYMQVIEARRNMYHAYKHLLLPELIFSVGDIDVIDIDEARPNFITNDIVEADIVNLDLDKDASISNKIVVVTKADPGYDWIFSKNIAGFVTKYGGAASHMAIRCAEFGIPAAIGCGEKIFRKIEGMKRMELDCAGSKITEK